ncbi:hypothetical protein K7X08_017010 [Anisodus acutangulus]|uniref:Beta-amylase n=1 Tax=Anisodus acutangulus TaxID=402998 RepID=A0A9Q1LRL6_9SOLA|nr:hypothetical protein K7X08_017010 [Anisodus acutangulus]
MGPAGDLRYPSYPEKDGVLELFSVTTSSLRAAAEAFGKPEWGNTGPTDAGEYNNWPEDKLFQERRWWLGVLPHMVFSNAFGPCESDDREMCAFTYLRMNPDLFQPNNWRRFIAFVKKMNEGKDVDHCSEQVEREAEHFVHVTHPLVQKPAVALML